MFMSFTKTLRSSAVCFTHLLNSDINTQITTKVVQDEIYSYFLVSTTQTYLYFLIRGLYRDNISLFLHESLKPFN